jgi:cation diffusion facilitator family transporter
MSTNIHNRHPEEQSPLIGHSEQEIPDHNHRHDRHQDHGRHGHNHALHAYIHDHTDDHQHHHGPLRLLSAARHFSYDHDQEPDDHEHDHQHGPLSFLSEARHFGRHHTGPLTDTALATSTQGINAVKLSLLVLLITALFQLGIALWSGSAGLLADTIHNGADALTAIPLWLAFTVGRRGATRRYTYGFRRAEDIAGIFIIAIILASALVAAWESVRKLLHPQPLSAAGWVMAAAVVGFLGNETAAQIRLTVGRRIGSAALAADGQHARADGLTSLAVLAGAIATMLGAPIADPIVGLAISAVILLIVKDAGLAIWRRLLDAVDPEIVTTIERVTTSVANVRDVHEVRVRWLGHELEAELHIGVPGSLPFRQAHDVAHAVETELRARVPYLTRVIVHADPVDETP